MSAAFTPGPWSVWSTRSLRDTRGVEVAHATFRATTAERAANARLIAAAPDNYECNAASTAIFRDIVNAEWLPDSWKGVVAERIRQNEAALAKARGQ